MNAKEVALLIRHSEYFSKEALYNLLAEECCELAQACLKKSRKLRGEIYTPKFESEIDDNVIEELTDVWLLTKVIGLDPDEHVACAKATRWIDRDGLPIDISKVDS